jgi:RNA polymerase sigma factor (sigma-70 family)
MSKAAASLSHGHIPVAGLRLLSDERLARRVAEGDGQAFAALYERHHQALYRYCRAILGNPEDAADALQNTMTAALRALPGEQREIRVKPWLYRIAHNESISLLRRRAPHAVLEEAMDVAAPRASDPGSRERLRQLLTDLHELQDRQRAALVMRELNGLQYEEIGAILDSTPAATKQLVYEARTALYAMAEGRDMSCDSIRLSLSADDRRRLRGRKVRAHLKACAACREFQQMNAVRRRDLAALAPPLPAIAAAAMLQGLGGGGHGGAAGSLAGLAGSGAGKAVATSAVAKGVAAVAVVATVGAGTAGLTGHLPAAPSHKSPRQAAGADRGSPSSAHGAGATPSETSQRGRAGATRRSEALDEQHGKGVDRRTRPRAHGGRRAMHLPPEARTPRGRRAKGTPHRSSSRRSVHPRPKSRRAGMLPGSKKVRPKLGQTVTAPTEKPADLPAPAPGNTSRP